jgi:hypothetical protein
VIMMGHHDHPWKTEKRSGVPVGWGGIAKLPSWAGMFLVG